jgi:hypothetical protein
MAHLDSISKQSLVTVAHEIGALIDSGLADYPRTGTPEKDGRNSDVAGASLQIGETLTVWKLQARAFETLEKSRLSGDLSDWVEQTPFLQHQIKLNGRAEGIARSYREKGIENRSVFQVAASPLASRINQLFEMIEDNELHDPVIKDDPVVRLLEVPAYHVFTLWLFAASQRESRIVIIDAPEHYAREKEPYLTSGQFFDALKENGPIPDIA